jgi:LmbE family N-acetylglucosaminyl deacetylase
MTKPHYRAIIISPHLDDAVFSCGGAITQMVKEGPVLVINIFTRYLSDIKFHGIVMGNERQQEEKSAANFLGYESRNLDELDAIYRHKTYQKISNIFYPPIEEDMQWLPFLRQKIFEIIGEVDYQEIYIPLGIGWHVDHILTNLVFEPMFCDPKLFFYEDTPYSLIAQTTRYRLSEFANYPDLPLDLSLKSSNEFLVGWQTSKSYAQTAMMKNIKPWIIRLFAYPVVSVYLIRLMSRHRKNFTVSNKINLKPHAIDINETFEKKIDAMMLYGSQFKEFFIDRKDCERLLKSYAKSMQNSSIQVERYWSGK